MASTTTPSPTTSSPTPTGQHLHPQRQHRRQPGQQLRDLQQPRRRAPTSRSPAARRTSSTWRSPTPAPPAATSTACSPSPAAFTIPLQYTHHRRGQHRHGRRGHASPAARDGHLHPDRLRRQAHRRLLHRSRSPASPTRAWSRPASSASSTPTTPSIHSPRRGTTNTLVASVVVTTGVTPGGGQRSTRAVYPVLNNQFLVGTTTYTVNVPVAYTNAAAGPY